MTLLLVLLLVVVLIASAIFIYRIGQRQAKAKIDKQAAQDANEDNEINNSPFVDNPLDRL
jgi:hypothetical protein